MHSGLADSQQLKLLENIAGLLLRSGLSPRAYDLHIEQCSIGTSIGVGDCAEYIRIVVLQFKEMSSTYKPPAEHMRVFQ